ncbi:MAG: hypothetical protein ACK2TV_00730 [Anaerolineales bacterium]
MITAIRFFFCAICYLFFLTGCGGFSHNAIGTLEKVMTPEIMDLKLETKSIDLSKEGRCPGTLALKVDSADTRMEPYVFFTMIGHKHYVVPKEFMELIARHMADELIASNIEIDKKNGRQILVSLEQAKVEGTMVGEGCVTIKVEIPDIAFSKSYTGIEGSPNFYHALAYGAHLAVVELLKDPAFQKFVRCQ